MIQTRAANHSDGGCSACKEQRAAIVVMLSITPNTSTQSFKLCHDCCHLMPEMIKESPKAPR